MAPARGSGRAGRDAAARGVATDVRAVRRGAGTSPRRDPATVGAAGRAARQLADERVGATPGAPATRPLPADRRTLLARRSLWTSRGATTSTRRWPRRRRGGEPWSSTSTPRRWEGAAVSWA